MPGFRRQEGSKVYSKHLLWLMFQLASIELFKCWEIRVDSSWPLYNTMTCFFTTFFYLLFLFFTYNVFTTFYIVIGNWNSIIMEGSRIRNSYVKDSIIDYTLHLLHISIYTSEYVHKYSTIPHFSIVVNCQCQSFHWSRIKEAREE